MSKDDEQPALAGSIPEHAPTSYLDEEELNRFLILIRDSYQKADLANLFLEQNCQEPTVNVAAIANLRDVLSHFATFLRNGLAPEKRKEQIINATEHLHRAILEPYELTYRDNVRHFRDLFQQYVEELLPEKDQHPFLSSAPTRHNIESRLGTLHEEAEKGRLAKGNNDCVPDWEAGILCYLRAFENLRVLTHEVEEHWYKFQEVKKVAELQEKLAEADRKIEDSERKHQQEISMAIHEIAKTHKHSTRLHYFAIAIAVILFIFTDYQFHVVDRIVALVSWLWHGIHSLFSLALTAI
jgi:hypothetical protein